jgi:N utilization substance protein B
VLQVLFAADATETDPLAILSFFENHFADDQDQIVKLHRVMQDYARELVSAVSRDREIIDKIISKLSHNWKLYRINRVDRNILRMAIAEMTTFPDVPGPVVLNEAIEIGKKYGAENSASFINGILDTVKVLQTKPSSPAHLHELLAKLDQSGTTY